MTEIVGNQNFNNRNYLRQNQPSAPQAMGQGENDAMAVSTEIVASNPLVRSTSRKRPSDALVTAALTVPTYAGFYYGVDTLNKKMQGKYADTMLGKLAAKGNAIEGNKFYQDTVGRARSWAKSAGSWINANVIEKSNVLKAFKTPVSAEWAWAKTQSGGLKGFAGTDNVDIIDKVITSYAKKELEPKALAKNIKLKDYIYAHGAEYEKLRSKFLKSLFNLTDDELMAIQKNSGSVESLTKAKAAFKHAASKNLTFTLDKLWVFNLPKFLQRKIPATEQLNKIEALLNSGSVKAKGLGKLLPKAPLAGMEALTNGAFGGKLALAFGSIFVAMSLNTALKESGISEKFKRFSEELTSMFGFLISMPFAAMAFYRTAGLKYTGASKESVKKYKDAISDLNKLNASGAFKTKQEYKEAVKNVKKLISDSSPTTLQKIWHAPFRFAGRTLSIGLDKIKPWNNVKGGTASRFFKSSAHEMKNFAGGVGRLAIIGFCITPIFSDAMLKLTHMIVGKPKNSLLDEGKEEEQPKTEYQGVSPVTVPSGTASSQAIAAQNILEHSQPVKSNPYKEAQQKLNVANKPYKARPDEVGRTYIPSPVATEFVQELEPEQVQRTNEVLIKAHKAGKRAEEILND